MKKQCIAAFLAAFLCTPLPASAADWSSGDISCNVEILEIGSIWFMHEWGIWKEIKFTFFATKDPASSYTYTCYNNDPSHKVFSCGYRGTYNVGRYRVGPCIQRDVTIELIPGSATKYSACQKLEDKASIRMVPYVPIEARDVDPAYGHPGYKPK